MLKSISTRSWWCDILLLSFIVGIFYFLFIGSYPLSVPDGARYAEIAREMSTSGDFITPHLNGIKYFEKPPLFYWLQATAIRIGGVHIGILQFTTLCMGVLGCLLTYIAGRKLFDRHTGWVASLLLASSALYFAMAHLATLDMTLTVFLSGALFFCLFGLTEINTRARCRWMMIAFVFSALAVLTKGLIGFVFPCFITGVWILCLHQWSLLKKLCLPASFFIFLILVLPWHVLVQLKNTEFLNYYIVDQHFLRFLKPNVEHDESFFYFFGILLLGFFPWIVFAIQTFSFFIKKCFQDIKAYQKELFLLLWAILIFIFFSCSHSKLIPYILPIFPALSLLTARYLLQWKNLEIGFHLLLIFSFILTFVLFIEFLIYPVPQRFLASFYVWLASILLLLGSGIAWFFMHYKKYRCALFSVLIMACGFLISLLMASPYIESKSTRSLVDLLKPLLKPGDIVVSYEHYYHDLPLYLERTITVVNWQGELAFGIAHAEKATDWMIDKKTFWRHWNSPQKMYMIMDCGDCGFVQREHPEAIFHILKSTIRHTLVVNQK